MCVSIKSRERRALISAFEALQLMIAFAMLVLAIKNDNKK
ncbi:putative holin-like toxin [Enterococcus hirae]|nr:putative holin-like toxin [Enterococcus hirae]EMF0070994.1 putative holin-like toxin [Enterococcus hirae]EMF0081423.1 putative holin-like toxin [Enterococcus hirae]EMF0128803.1 putative holin-like toxin [Enterococcus hirae]EMF0167690.1 putative holin-like toxin [Enterococcus hirae]EMF0172648.1 putative holin-like toxin [Enterococcus hirae]